MPAQFLLFGDSITQRSFGEDNQPGWGSLLAHTFQRQVDIINRGLSGYNTTHALQVSPFIITPSTTKHTKLFTVFFGANDAALEHISPQHIPLNEYKSNLITIVEQIKAVRASPSIPIIVITPPPVDEGAWFAQCKITNNAQTLPNRTNSAAKAYGEAAKDAFKTSQYLSENVFICDSFDALGGNDDNYIRHLNDGLHLSGSGNVALYDALIKVIVDECKISFDEDERSFPYDFPEWREMLEGIAIFSPTHYPKGLNAPFLNGTKEEIVEFGESKFEDPAVRDIAKCRDEIVRRIGNLEGKVVADVGAGTGLFLDAFKRAVGQNGKVIACELSPAFASHLEGKFGDDEVVEVVRCTAKNSNLKDRGVAVDVSFICDVYHHFLYPKMFMRSLWDATEVGGRVVVVDFIRDENVHKSHAAGWISSHVRGGQEVFRGEIEDCGWAWVEDLTGIDGMEENYVMVFQKRDSGLCVEVKK